jgi:uncharacterized membrane protein YciS (DUF1049 family)
VRTVVIVIVVLAVAGGLVYVGAQNTLPIATIDLYVVRYTDVPLWLALALSILVGAALAALVFSLPIMRLKLRVRRAHKRVTELEREVHGLRTLPLEAGEARASGES